MLFRGGDSRLFFQSWMWSIMWFSLESGRGRRLQQKQVSMHERVLVCHLASLISAGCFPSGGHQLWSSHTKVEEKGPWEVTAMCGQACLHVSTPRTCERCVCSPSALPRGSSVCACCLVVCFLSCVWRAHKQDDAAGRKLWSHQACQQGQFFIR